MFWPSRPRLTVGVSGAPAVRQRAWLAIAVLIGVLTLPVSSFGLAQLATTVEVQLAGPADTTDFLAYYGGAAQLWRDPAHLYDTAVHQALQRGLQGGRDAYVPFVSPPHVPLVQAPLGL
ncbi:MAG TPA: hypothetical protein VFA49_09670, partial [Chloroflexota bacterium]|nr:hypothetical protein [Chloroflexota bacterium]